MEDSREVARLSSASRTTLFRGDELICVGVVGSMRSTVVLYPQTKFRRNDAGPDGGGGRIRRVEDAYVREAV